MPEYLDFFPIGECEYCKEGVEYQEEAAEVAASASSCAVAVAVAGVVHGP